MNDVTIRFATISDIAELITWRMRVLHEAFADSADADWPTLQSANRRYYVHELSMGTLEAVLAKSTTNDTIGCGDVCYQRELPSPDNPSGINAYLMNIYVDPNHRHHSVGQAIVDSLVDLARQRNAGKIYLETTEAGRHSIKIVASPTCWA